MSDEEIELALASLYFGRYHYRQCDGWMQLNVINDNILKFGKPHVEQIFRLQWRLVENKKDSKDTYYRLTPDGTKFVDEWGDEKKEKYRQILKARNFDPRTSALG
jgi:hypothetical protein